MSHPKPDSVLLEVYRHRFAGVADEMGITLQRTAYSPNIKERLDYSCAVFDPCGRMVAQAAHIPVHLGAMPDSCAAALKAIDTWNPGDLVALNDPYEGGNHLPDITTVSPVFYKEKLLFLVATRAHHADVGGLSPGSLALSTELYQEGIIIPPVKLYRGGKLNKDLMALILRNVRTPHERLGDIEAQRASHTVGEGRLLDLVSQYGEEEVLLYAAHLQSYSERITRSVIATWPPGPWKFSDYLELPDGNSPCIRVAATIEDDTITFDFRGTDPVMQGPLNTVLSVTRSACYYVVRCLIQEDIPVNSGCFAPVNIITSKGSIVDALPPAAVAGGNVETSQRITDVAFGALSQALPNSIAAAGQGTMNNVTIGGMNTNGAPYAYYETLGGGMGASPVCRGLDGVHVHMSNTLNTPVEALEMQFPFRIRTYSLRNGSGGWGRFRGGEGLIREYELLRPATVTMLSERRRYAPWGLEGGKSGATGHNVLYRKDGDTETLAGKFSRQLEPGDRLRIETPGGGGWG